MILNGFRRVGVPLTVTPQDLEWGRVQCAKLDRRYGKRRFPTEEHDDSRWRGSVADRVVERYLREICRAPFNWFPDGGYGAPDYQINHATAELKTCVRNVPPLASYAVKYPANGYDRRPDEAAADAVCFASYERVPLGLDVVWFLGGYDRKPFLRIARFVARGETVDMRPDGSPFIASDDLYTLEIGDNLTAPRSWLRDLELRP